MLCWLGQWILWELVWHRIQRKPEMLRQLGRWTLWELPWVLDQRQLGVESCTLTAKEYCTLHVNSNEDLLKSSHVHFPLLPRRIYLAVVPCNRFVWFLYS